MTQLVFGPNKAYPSIPSIGNDILSHTAALEAMREALEIHERRTKNISDSFVRVSELQDLGLLTLDGDTGIVEDTDDDGSFIRRDGTSAATTGMIDIGAGITIAGTINVSGATFSGLSSDDLADVASLGMLDENETVTGNWTFTGTTTVPEATVTAHEAALTILESQISDLGTYTEASANETITGSWKFSGPTTTIESSEGILRLQSTSAVTNEKRTYISQNASGNFTIQSYSDGGFLGDTLLIGTRSGTAWSSLSVSTDFEVLGGLLRVFDSGETDYIQFDHDGTDANVRFANTVDFNIDFGLALTGQIKVFADTHLVSGSELQLRDPGNTDTATFSHDGTNLYTEFVNTSQWVVRGATGESDLQYFSLGRGTHLRVFDPTGTDIIELSDSGSVATLSSTNVVNLDAPGVRVIGGQYFRIYDPTNSDYVQMSHDGTDFNFGFTGTADLNITGLSALVVGNYTFNVDETVGVSQDSYALRYDHASGELTLQPTIESAYGLRYEYDSTTTAADPGAGKFRFNSTSAASIDTLYVNDSALNGDSGEYVFNAQIDVGDEITLRSTTDPTKYLTGVVTSATDNTGWWTIEFTRKVFSAPTFTDGDVVVIDMQWLSDAPGTIPDGTTQYAIPHWSTSGGQWEEPTGGSYVRTDGANFFIYDTTGADRVQMWHDGADLNFDFVGTTNLNIKDGVGLVLQDITGADSVRFSHDGTDFNIDGTNTTDINITGIASLVAGAMSIDVENIDAADITGDSLYLNEQSTPDVDIAGDGQFWVRNTTPMNPWFTDEDSNDYPLGYGAYRMYANQSDTVDAGYINGAWYSDNATTYTLTLQASGLSTFPVGAQISVWNEGTGTLTINEGSGTTLYYMDGSGTVTDTAGGMTLAQGGFLTIIRKSSTVYLAMGAGGTA